MLEYRRLRRECGALVDALDIPRPFDLEAFCTQVGYQRGRVVQQVRCALPNGIYGLWMSTDDVEYIVVEARTSPMHQQMIALHELGHILWKHEAVPATGGDIATMLMPNLDPGMVRRMLGRDKYTSLEERQAEMTASLILQRVSTWRAEPSGTAPSAATAGLAGRLEHSLLPPDQWTPASTAGVTAVRIC